MRIRNLLMLFAALATLAACSKPEGESPETPADQKLPSASSDKIVTEEK